MTYLQEKNDIEAHFLANWTDTPVYFENGAKGDETEWVRLSIQNGKAYQASMGDAPTFRHPGILYIQIFTAKDVGSGRALELADKVDALYRTAVISGIHFKVPRVDKVPSNAEHFQVNVSTEYYRGS